MAWNKLIISVFSTITFSAILLIIIEMKSNSIVLKSHFVKTVPDIEEHISTDTPPGSKISSYTFSGKDHSIDSNTNLLKEPFLELNEAAPSLNINTTKALEIKAVEIGLDINVSETEIANASEGRVSEIRASEASVSKAKEKLSNNQTPNVRPRVRSAPKVIRHKAWFSKINYFVAIKQDSRNIHIARKIKDPDINKETLIGTYNSTLLSLTAGGNLFKKTSINLDINLNRYELFGNVDGFYKVPVKYQRRKTLVELFVEYDLGDAYTLAFDLYYGGDKYKDKGADKVYFDEEKGADVMFSKKYRFDSLNARLDYIFAYRTVDVELIEDGERSRDSHNMLASIIYNFNYEFSTKLSARFSYFPTFSEYNYWEAEYIYSTGAEINYRLGDTDEISIATDVMQYGDDSIVSTFAIRFEHLFGAKTSKRRQRRYKIPNLLIK